MSETKIVICQEWSEFGGSFNSDYPSAYSLHLTLNDWAEFKDKVLHLQQKATSIHCSYPLSPPYPVKVSEEDFAQISAARESHHSCFGLWGDTPVPRMTGAGDRIGVPGKFPHSWTPVKAPG
jgi:hypothetical protein